MTDQQPSDAMIDAAMNDKTKALVERLMPEQKRAYLSATPSLRAADPESLFVRDTRGCRGRDLPGTMVTLNGLMLTPLGVEIRAALNEDTNHVER